MTEDIASLLIVLGFGIGFLFVHYYFLKQINRIQEQRAKILKFQRIKKNRDDR